MKNMKKSMSEKSHIHIDAYHSYEISTLTSEAVFENFFQYLSLNRVPIIMAIQKCRTHSYWHFRNFNGFNYNITLFHSGNFD